jgi:predicted  nucleic acid-binding Zn-ribbon protein
MKDERLMQMAMLLKAIDDETNDFATAKTEHKDTMEKLHNELRKLKYEVLTGQQTIPLEPPEKAA